MGSGDPGSTPVLRWIWAPEETKVARVREAEYRIRESCTEREPHRYPWSAHSYKEPTQDWGKNHPKGLKWKIPRLRTPIKAQMQDPKDPTISK